MNNGMKDLLNVADKLMLLGQTIPEVVAEMTSHPAHEIKQEQLGNLSVGSVADVAVLSVETGNFGFVDMYNTKMRGRKRLVCELTLRNGKVVYNFNAFPRTCGTRRSIQRMSASHPLDDLYGASIRCRPWTTFSAIYTGRPTSPANSEIAQQPRRGPPRAEAATDEKQRGPMGADTSNY
jgi:hypothetical protein